MKAIITGDIINSRKLSSALWMEELKKYFLTFGESPKNWEIYRGDQFQLEITNPEEALQAAILIKAFLKARQLDVRMSIGLGNTDYNAGKITESNGEAFIRSGELFETLKRQKVNLAINSGHKNFDEEMNLMFRLSLSFMDNWLQQSAEFVLVALDNPDASQEEIGAILGIKQAAVSRRQKRAHYDLVKELNAYYKKRVITL